MITDKPRHLPTFRYVGLYRYFLTFCTDRRRAAFVDPQRVDVARMQILRAAYSYERVLRDDDCTLVVARYILENPVRAGLVDRPEAYRFSGSTTHSLRQVLDAVGEMKRW